jgi:hypothetical protein
MTTKYKKLSCLLFVTVIYFIAGIVVNSTMPVLVFAQEEDHGHDHGHAPEVYKDKLIPVGKRKGPFKGYGKQASQFKKLCEAIAADDRLEFLVSSAKQFSDRDPACEACRNFMQSFTNNCKTLSTSAKPEKSKKETKSASENPEEIQPTPTAVPKVAQREPSALVIDRAVRLFDNIASDDDLRDKTLQAVNKLKFVLLDKNRSTVASREYYDNLFTYIYEVFEQYSSKKANSSSDEDLARQLEPSEDQKNQHLESLFDQ